jgi:alpha-1,2-mannosyltransferase
VGQVTATGNLATTRARVILVLLGLAAAAAYVLPGMAAPGAHWPLWDVQVYWWGGQQAAHGGALYAPGSPSSFTYPPFAAMAFSLAAATSLVDLKIAITVASVASLAVLCALTLGAAGVPRRPGIVFAVTALAMLTGPVAYTLHLGEVNLILAALAGTDLLRRRDGGWWQGAGIGLAAGIKLTPLIFVLYLLVTGRVRAAVTAAITFGVTIAAGFAVLPASSRVFWLGGVFFSQSRIGNPANPSDQSLNGAIARLAGTAEPPRAWWLPLVLVTVLGGLAIAGWAHRRGYRLAGLICCAITGLLVSPISWTHHWVWVVPLLVMLTAAAWRRRSPRYVIAAAAAITAFCVGIPIPWAGHPPSAGRLLASDLYVQCGLAVLIGTALVLWRDGTSARRREVPGMKQPDRSASPPVVVTPVR